MRAPDYIIKALEHVRKDYPDAFVAGGSLRDIMHGETPKDIDVFTFLEPLPGATSMLPDNGEIANDEQAEVYEASDRILQAQQPIKVDGVPHPVQIVHLIPPTDEPPLIMGAIGEFNFGLNQIAFDGNTFWETRAYWDDFESQSFTLMRARTQSEFYRCVLKAALLRDKYPNHKLVVPLHLTECA